MTRYSSWREAQQDSEKRANQGDLAGGTSQEENKKEIDRAMERKMEGWIAGGVLMTQ